MSKYYFVYIMTSDNSKVLYTGVTSNLKQRVYKHKAKLLPGFTERYNVNRLVYYETHGDINEAIKREKKIKGGSRKKKKKMINDFNLNWKDLYDDL